MQPNTLLFALGGLGLANAASAPQSFVVRNALSPTDTLYVTFWEAGCGVDGDANQATQYINNSDGSNAPEDCVINQNYGWQSVEIRQPSDTQYKYTIDLFSGEGCNNPILTVSENGCYTQPEGQIVETFRAHLL